eukprot:gene2803-719_t
MDQTNKAISKQYCTTHGAKGKCKHDGCATNIDRNGLCKKHFSRGTCSETDCSKYVEARGLCDSHWKEKRGQLQARSNNQDNKGPPTSPKRATRGNWQRAAKRKAPVSSQAGKPPRKVKPTTAQRSNKSQAKARRTTSAPTTLSTTPAPAQAPAATTTTVFAPAHPATYSTPMLIPKHLQLQLQQQQREIQQPASLQHYDHTLSAAAVQRLATARVQQGTCPAVTPVLQTQLLAEAPDQQHQHLLYLQHANARLVVQQSQSHLTQQLHHPGHHLRQQHESYPLLALQERAHVHAYVPVQLPTPACGLRLDASASSHVHSGMHASAGYMSDTSQSGPHE